MASVLFPTFRPAMGEVNRQALAIVKHVHVIIIRNWLQLLCCTYLLVVIVKY